MNELREALLFVLGHREFSELTKTGFFIHSYIIVITVVKTYGQPD